MPTQRFREYEGFKNPVTLTLDLCAANFWGPFFLLMHSQGACPTMAPTALERIRRHPTRQYSAPGIGETKGGKVEKINVKT